jgi:hypothetical protein
MQRHAPLGVVIGEVVGVAAGPGASGQAVAHDVLQEPGVPSL